MSELEIRAEHPSDYKVIRSITEIAFRDMPYAGGDEQDVIDRLRNADALTLSLLAVMDKKAVGHIAFSPATLQDGSQPWFALGPVSVIPTLQGQGIGSMLIEQGLAQIMALDALGCILTGNPNYYNRFGFQLAPKHVPSNESAEFFMLNLFTSVQPVGSFFFHEAFYGEA